MVSSLIVSSLHSTSAISASVVAIASRRLLSTSLRAQQAAAAANEEQAKSKGTWATFAEYRRNIIKRDPVTMATRNNIMAPHMKEVKKPEEELEREKSFETLAKKVAY